MLRFAHNAPAVKDPTGVEYLVMTADSYAARLASHVRKVRMTDNTEWTVGYSRVGQRISTPIAWRP